MSLSQTQYTSLNTGRPISSAQKRTLDVLGKHFTVKLEDVKQGRWWTLITPAFSHVQPDHIIRNLVAFSDISNMLIQGGIGPAKYALLVLGSAVSGNVAFLYQASCRQPTGMASIWAYFTQRTEVRALGLSGVVMGLGTALAPTGPEVGVLLFGIIPIPFWLMMVLYIIFDSVMLGRQNSEVGHAAHLGGAAFGAAFYLLELRRKAALRSGRVLQ